MCDGHKKFVWTLGGDPIDVSSCNSLREAKRTIARRLAVPPEELLLLCGREMLVSNDVYRQAIAKTRQSISSSDTTPKQLRVVHRPFAPSRSNSILRYSFLAVYFLIVVWYTHLDTTMAGLLSTLLMVIGFRWTNRQAWQRIFPPPSPSRHKGAHPPSPKEHLAVCPLYNESETYLEPMLSSLIQARRTWPLTVLFAAEMAMDEHWIVKATRRLEKSGVAVVTVRHPSKLLNEVPGAASNINFALEMFCFDSEKNPNNYLVTKCDSNGAVDETYFLELESLTKSFRGEAFFVQPRPRWQYTGKWSWMDSLFYRRLNVVLQVGEGGVSHFSFPLAQFIRVGRYSHSSMVVLDDGDCYMQQEMLGVHYVEPKTYVQKVIPSSSDITDRLFQKWLPQCFGTVIVEMSFRRNILYPFRLCGSMFYFVEVVVCIKLALILRNFI